MTSFPYGGRYLVIKPGSFGPEQRLEASALAAESGEGVRMEVHSSSTTFFATPDVPVGKIEVWDTRTYKGQLEFDIVLDTPDQYWMPYAQRGNE